MAAYITKQELRAVLVAWDELVSYIDTVGEEGELEQWDDDDPKRTTLTDAERDISYLLARNGLLDVVIG